MAGAAPGGGVDARVPRQGRRRVAAHVRPPVRFLDARRQHRQVGRGCAVPDVGQLAGGGGAAGPVGAPLEVAVVQRCVDGAAERAVRLPAHRVHAAACRHREVHLAWPARAEPGVRGQGRRGGAHPHLLQAAPRLLQLPAQQPRRPRAGTAAQRVCRYRWDGARRRRPRPRPRRQEEGVRARHRCFKQLRVFVRPAPWVVLGRRRRAVRLGSEKLSTPRRRRPIK